MREAPGRFPTSRPLPTALTGTPYIVAQLLVAEQTICCALTVSSFASRLCVVNVGDYAVTCGAIGSAFVTMLWFYVSRIAIVIGAELNGVIKKVWRSIDA
jgi:uncharacterized BrkB/YihY/UPF0761 family membrane protein